MIASVFLGPTLLTRELISLTLCSKAMLVLSTYTQSHWSNEAQQFFDGMNNLLLSQLLVVHGLFAD